MRNRLMALGLTAVLVAGTGVAAQRVNADAFGQSSADHTDPETGSIPDNLQHSYCFEDYEYTAWDDEKEMDVAKRVVLSDVGRAAVHRQMANLARQTIYEVDYQARCDDRTDVKVTPRPDGPWGVWSCTKGVPGTKLCEQGELTLWTWPIDPSMTPVFEESYPVSGREWFAKVACHEIGHSVGLAHNSENEDDCMWSGNAKKGIPLGYNAHHVEHINSRRPTTR
jgi:hypothetical protein